MSDKALPYPGVRKTGIDQAGQGAIVNQGMHKLAVYRDEHGALHALSARCTHLGCAVHFNSAEPWDCPCHGSRYDINGTMLHDAAPAILDQGQRLDTMCMRIG